jgi:peptidoglycan/xylan/chitin deacetylase (PgdA/CDA1 family)
MITPRPLPSAARAPRAWSRLAALLVALAAAVAALPTQVAATPSPPRYQGQISRVAPGRGRVALTFDADAWPGRTWDIINTLAAYHVRATFFLTGTYMDTFPTRTRGLIHAGQEVASHGYEHRDYRDLTDGGIVRRLAAWDADYMRLTGGDHGPAFWRAPYGYSDNRVRVAAAEAGYSTIYWTLDSLDTIGAPKSESFIFNRLTRSTVNLDGAILLLHVNSNGTVDALPRVLANLQARGLDVVTVSALLAR